MATDIPRGITAGSGGPGGSGGAGRPARPAGGWTVGRVVTLIIGSVLALVSLGLLGGGVTGVDWLLVIVAGLILAGVIGLNLSGVTRP